MKLDRREFLATALGGVSALALGSSVAGDPAPVPGPFDLVPLGKTGLKVSRLGFGTGTRGSMRQANHTRMGPDKLEALLKYAYDRGVRLFDMADLYGTHPYLLRALRGVPREKITIVSKIWILPGGIPEKERPDADVVIDRFRRELNTDYIDLVLLHCMMADNWTDAHKRQMEILAGLKAKGIIRAHGCSCHTLAALKASAASPWVDSVHARINPFGLAMDGKPKVVVPILQQLHEAGKGVIGMKILGEGRLKDDARKNESVRYVVNLGCVDAMIVGFEKLEELDDFAPRLTAALQPRA